MASNEDILKEADYYLDNDVTIEQASSDLGISKRTLQLHLQKLKSIAPDKFVLVTDKKKSNERRGKITGGSLGKRGATWTDEQALDAAQIMINGGLTYEQASQVLNIPSSTLYEMIHKGVTDPDTTSLLYALSEANRRNMSLEEYQRRHSSEHVASDIISRQIREENLPGKKSK